MVAGRLRAVAPDVDGVTLAWMGQRGRARSRTRTGGPPTTRRIDGDRPPALRRLERAGSDRRPRQPGEERCRADLERRWATRIRRVRRLGSLPLPFLYHVHRKRGRPGRSRSVCERSTSPISPGRRSVAAHSGAAISCPSKPFRNAQLDRSVAAIAQGPGRDGRPATDRRREVRGPLLGRRRPQPGRPSRSTAARSRSTRTSSSSCRWARDAPSRSARSRPSVAASRAVRTAGRGHRPSHALADEDAVSIEPPDDGG